MSDVSFYFVHWLTDLAGAEPTPLRGSEKFVLRLPHPVLHSFVSSFSFVGSLVDDSETSVFESFLVAKWEESARVLGRAPRGRHAVALMRLIAQLQHLPLQQLALAAWPKLEAHDAEVLSREMALTGCAGQQYSRLHAGAPAATAPVAGLPQVAALPPRQGGPVFLLYHSPAFLRSSARSDVLAGLRMLADVYRQARSLWPFAEGGLSAREHVTIRIDQMKDRTPQHIEEGHLWGDGWLLVRHNEREGIVEHHPLYAIHDLQSGELGGPVPRARLLAARRRGGGRAAGLRGRAREIAVGARWRPNVNCEGATACER